MSDYTPPMERLRREYIEMREAEFGFSDLYAAEWDRALAVHDAEVRADIQRTIDDLGEELKIAREGREAALEVMDNHRCGEQAEAAYRRALLAEQGTEEPEWEYGSKGYCFDWDDRRCRWITSDLAGILEHEEEAHGGSPSYPRRRHKAGPWLPVEQGDNDAR